jgi:acetyl-CoA carboxylase carboxyl transferase subunit alpha
MTTYWDSVVKARSSKKPQIQEYIDYLFTDFCELHGDGLQNDDQSITGGLAYFQGRKCVVLGISKGNTTEERLKKNFGMPQPSGYRKAKKFLALANDFSLPVIAFIDTPGAYPGKEAEENGQSRAIAEILEYSFCVQSLMISIITGEGGSGGALALGIGNYVCMMEDTIYSVISPESCSSILWPGKNKFEEAAQNLKILPEELKNFGLIDEILSWENLPKRLHYFFTYKIQNYASHRFDKFRNLDKLYIKES